LAILVKSFARIHETNLKKQGMLALTFVNPDDYEKIRPDDRVDIRELKDFKEGQNMTLVLKHRDGQKDVSVVSDSFFFFFLSFNSDTN
jgi:aconitate hydratase